MRVVAGLVVLPPLLVALACATMTPPPGEDWPRCGFAEAGLDAAPVNELVSEIEAGKYHFVDGISIVRHGALVFDRDFAHDYATIYAGRDASTGPYNYFSAEWHPYYHGTSLHTMQSVTKSVTSAALGIAVGRGEIPSVDAPVLHYFGERVQNVDERKRRLTLRHLLTMTAGLDWDEISVPYEDPSNVCTRMEASADWVAFTIDRPMIAEPGTTFAYSSGVSQLLSKIALAATGRTIDEYARDHLFAPLGIREFHWKRAPGGLPDTEGGLYLRRLDLANIGQLFLYGGRWHGAEIVPKAWVDASVAPSVSAEAVWPTAMYGYQWWLPLTDAARGRRAWMASGYGGQSLLVFPDIDLVIAVTSWNIAEYDGIPEEKLFELARRVTSP
ncbi:MAG: serine hydrolase [Planctomycetes bacterium]|nr:serine hydrolase [Planctomycetota bacterium]